MTGACPERLAVGALARLAPPAACAFFLDVDGTLLDIRPRPEDVRADAALLALIGDLAQAAGGALALVSGRAIDDLDRIFAPMILPAAGLHGAELRFADGTRTIAAQGIVDAARPKLAAFVAAREGLRLEDKGATLALHYRQRPDLAGEALSFIATLADRPGLVVQPGKMVAELKSADHNKATGMAHLMTAQPFAGRRPVFVGDDLTDEIGFGYVNGEGGASVRIAAADAPSAACWRLEDPSRFRAELAALVAAC